MLNEYKNYLERLNGYLTKFFTQQEPYIFCKEGCSKCCEKGIYPFTKLEFEYLKSGIETLETPQKEALFERIKNLKLEKSKCKDGEKFFYTCPFLENKKCILYEYRAIECRCYGLSRYYTDSNDEEHYTLPACIDERLNYSNVFDFEKNSFSQELVDKLKLKDDECEPQFYNLGLTFLTTASIAQGLDFGESKALLDWL